MGNAFDIVKNTGQGVSAFTNPVDLGYKAPVASLSFGNVLRSNTDIPSAFAAGGPGFNTAFSTFGSSGKDSASDGPESAGAVNNTRPYIWKVL